MSTPDTSLLFQHIDKTVADIKTYISGKLAYLDDNERLKRHILSVAAENSELRSELDNTRTLLRVVTRHRDELASKYESSQANWRTAADALDSRLQARRRLSPIVAGEDIKKTEFVWVGQDGLAYSVPSRRNEEAVAASINSMRESAPPNLFDPIINTDFDPDDDPSPGRPSPTAPEYDDDEDEEDDESDLIDDDDEEEDEDDDEEEARLASEAIEGLRNEIDSLKNENTSLISRLHNLRNDWTQAKNIACNVADENRSLRARTEKLIADRDKILLEQSQQIKKAREETRAAKAIIKAALGLLEAYDRSPVCMNTSGAANTLREKLALANLPLKDYI